MPSRSNLKQVDKQLDIVRKQFARQALILKKVPSFLKKAKAFGRATGVLPPEPFLATLITYMVAAMAKGSKNSKKILKMLESEFGPEVSNGVESLAETLMYMEDDEPLTESNTRILIGFENVIHEMITDDWDSQRLNLRTLVEEVHKVAPSVAPSNKVGKKEMSPTELKLKRFKSFLSMFQTKLAEFNIVEDERIAEFLLSMTAMIQRINIKKRAEVKSHGK